MQGQAHTTTAMTFADFKITVSLGFQRALSPCFLGTLWVGRREENFPLHCSVRTLFLRPHLPAPIQTHSQCGLWYTLSCDIPNDLGCSALLTAFSLDLPSTWVPGVVILSLLCEFTAHFSKYLLLSIELSLQTSLQLSPGKAFSLHFFPDFS